MRGIIKIMVISLCICLPVNGQTSRVMHFMDLPQQRFLNPAFRPSDSMYIGLPVLTGIGVSVNNNFVNFDDVIMKGNQDTLITFLHPDYDREEFLAKVRNHNSFDADLIVQLLSFGISLNSGYLFFDLNTRVTENLTAPRELIELAMRGNAEFAGRFTDLSSVGGRVSVYHEAGIGYSRNLGSGLRAGIRAKALLGIASTDIDNRRLGFDIAPDLSHSINADMTFNFVGRSVDVNSANGEVDRIGFEPERIPNAVLLSEGLNPGFGFDIGATYDMTPELQISAAITDLGMIFWRSSVRNLTVENENFQITGIDVSDVLSGDESIEDAFNQLIDSLQESFPILTSSVPYSTGISPALNMGASYKISPGLMLGVLSHSRFAGTQVHQSVTLSANYRLNNRLSASVGYTAANHRYDNIGAGFAVRAGIFQFYAATDRIPLFWNRITVNEGRNSIILPSNWNTIDFRCGMNLVFGNRKYRRADECDFWYR